MKTLQQWMSERGLTEANSFGVSTEYDEDLVKTQVNDWITKLVGLCYDMPTKEKKKMTEDIVKSIRNRMLKG